MAATDHDRSVDCWELWNLRALLPEADLADLARLRDRQGRIRRHQERAWRALHAHREDLFGPGVRFLADHPELTSGLLVSMHIGPYQFLPQPLLQAGKNMVILLDDRAFRHLHDNAIQMQRTLDLPGELQWIPISAPSFVHRLVAAIRRPHPVLVFLDGNGGLGGTGRTREHGMPYQLPGRKIRVRTGLGRLIARLGCPVHPVTVRWDEAGRPVWRKAASRCFSPSTDPAEITRQLYAWGFAEVLATPEQWSYWSMLTESFDCFVKARLSTSGLPPDLRADYRRALDICCSRAPETVRVRLSKNLEVWPGDVLADLTDDCFYAAEGLRAEDLRLLRQDAPTLAALCRRRGRQWVRFHVLRLCIMEMAHLQGVASAGSGTTDPAS